MMTYKNILNVILPLGLLLVSFSSCKEDRIDPKKVGNQPISFTSNIYLRPTEPLRAYDKTWEKGDQIAVYMLKSGVTLAGDLSEDDLPYKAVKYKATSTAAEVNFDPLTDGDKMFFPRAYDVDFLAYYPASLQPDNEQNIALNMKTAPTDILYCNNLKGKNKDSKKSDLVLTFSHVLSSIRVAVKTTNGDLINDAKVSLKGFKTTGSFSLIDGKVSGIDAPMEVDLVQKDSYYRTIVLPQSIEDEVTKLLFEYKGRNYEYKLPKVDFTPGKQVYYEFKMGGEKLEVVVAGSISAWDEIDGGKFTIKPIKKKVVPKVEDIAPIEYWAEYDVNMDGTGFTSDHSNASAGHFNFYECNGIKNKDWNPTGKNVLDHPAFKGWHVPHYYELHVLMPKCLLDASDKPLVLYNQKEDVMIKGVTKVYEADYDRTEAFKKKECDDIYAIRLKGHGDHYRSAYLYKRVDNPEGGQLLPDIEVCKKYIIKVRYLGPKHTDVKLEDIKKPEFWNDPNVKYVERTFPASGYHEPKTPGKRKSMGRGGWFWTSSTHCDIPMEDDEQGVDWCYDDYAIALLFAELHWDATVRGFSEKKDSYALRLVKD